MKIFVVHRLEDQDGSINAFPIGAFTNRELALERLKEEYNKTIKSFNDNEEELETKPYDNGYELWNDESNIFLEIEEIELEGSLFVLNELNELEEDSYNNVLNIYTDLNEAKTSLLEELENLDEELNTYPDFEKLNNAIYTNTSKISLTIDRVDL